MSNMVVATNVLALNSHRNLKGVGQKQSLASQRLSSGYRINSAADDAAGLAISEKMRAQIRGLDQASTNAQDAISLIQTAEGGMQEIDNMVQRIRELVVQASNDTNDFDTEDRQKIQDEISQLLAEIDSMADRVEFNQKAVIDGSYEGTLKNTAVETAYKAARASTATAQSDVDTQAIAVAGAKGDLSTAVAALSNQITTDLALVLARDFSTIINSITADIGSKVDDSDVTKMTTAAYDAFLALANDVQTKLDSCLTAIYNIEGASDLSGASAALLALYTAADDLLTANTALKATDGTTSLTSTALSTELGLWKTATQTTGTLGTSLGTGGNIGKAAAKVDTDTAALATAQGTLDTLNGVLDIRKDAERNAWKNYTGAEREGGLYFQVGANSNQGIHVQIGSVKTDVMRIGNGEETGGGTPTVINVLKESGEDITELLDTLDDALSYVTTQRSKLGAVQNRLEYTINSLDISSENLSAAESRIRDTDMAKEMMNLTQANVLQQAATSMLAQANSAPQSILQLLS